jgi:hypothetical protein
MKEFEIIDIKPFVLTTDNKALGIAVKGCFASSAWCVSDEAFKGIMGTKFAWLAPDGGDYTDHRDTFKRSTEEQVKDMLSDTLIDKALSLGYIKMLES